MRTFFLTLLCSLLLGCSLLMPQRVTAQQSDPGSPVVENTSAEDLEFANLYLPRSSGFRLSKEANTAGRMLFGISDTAGKVVLPAIYKGIKRAGQYFIAKRLNLYQLYNNDFKRLLPEEFSYLEKTKIGDFFIVSVDAFGKRKFALIDPQGHYILKPAYKSIIKFYPHYNDNNELVQTDKFMIVQSDHGSALFNTITGKFETDFIYTNIDLNSWCFNARLKNRKFQLLDFSLKPIAYDILDEVSEVKNSPLLIIRKDSTMGVIAYGGKFVIPMQYRSIYTMECMGAVYFFTQLDGASELVNLSGKSLLKFSTYRALMPMRNQSGLLAKKDGKMGIIDCQDKAIVPFVYDSICQIDRLYFSLKADTLDVYSDAGKLLKRMQYDAMPVRLHGGYHTVYREKKAGIVNGAYNEVIPVMFDSISIFSIGNDPQFLVKNKGLVGIVTGKNETVLPVEYDSIKRISTKHLLLKQNGKYGLFDVVKMKVVLTCEFDLISKEPDIANRIKCVKADKVFFVE